MLTRIEIDGFKSFSEFSLNLAPFMVILGPNASGKSNLFDAIQLLSNLAHKDLRASVQGLRGEVDELFRVASEHKQLDPRICFAAEVLVEPQVQDPWGKKVEIRHTRLRYEVTLERRRDDRGIERLFVVHEQALPIYSKNDTWLKQMVKASKEFKARYVRYARREPFLETEPDEAQPSFRIRQDGRAGLSRPAQAAQATVLSSITNTEFPHLFALREEMRSWRLLQLDPASLRRPSPTMAEESLRSDGANLATVLARIKAETASVLRPKGDLADIAAELSRVIPGALDLYVTEDEERREYRIDFALRDAPFSSRVVSDGTLRVLALLTMLFDPQHRGLVCFEEPENGIHPARLRTLLEALYQLVSVPSGQEIAEDAPLVQLVMNSHSPVVLSALTRGEPGSGIVFSELTTVVEQGRSNRRTRMRPVRWNDQGEIWSDERGNDVTSFEANQFLATVDRGV